ncbi:General stress protein 39 [Aedoeadaptatus ivorii]|uniref:General stress protein 39 n=1 Tax=Aedoeadaptatus ivorii TaxID=54006 RepID=A0A3S4YPW4_9FIRM|nr:glucose 1-dehydrogenase [Peptoniphilus ivorii]MDQ0508203.1 NAD(P)-dependent dehydrogenase (short-subunit alcohol dehydrogenase family) [Peptoniphilus ivorii]VEJ35933.1 General stress protein 39 [Peptoniphilus ivorii]
MAKFDEAQYFDELERVGKEISGEQLPTRPGVEEEMQTEPVYDADFEGAGRLSDKVAVVTGGDSGIGRAVAIAYAKEGAKVAIVFLKECEDAEITAEEIRAAGSEALILTGDVGDKAFCEEAVEKTVDAFGKIDILVNNAGEQHPQESILDIDEAQLVRTFRTNLFSMFFMVQAALPHMQAYASIINTASVTAYEGNILLLDYSATKGAITAFTRSLAQQLAEQKIRVNQVAPGPIWTPLIPSTFEADHVKNFGKNTLMERAGQPVELAEAYVFLAWAKGSSFITGQTIHINGGQFVCS